MEKRLRVYVDTSVFGGCFDVEFKLWSNKLLSEFRSGSKIAVVSDITLNELRIAPREVREVIESIPYDNQEFVMLDAEAKTLADYYIREKAVSQKFEEDAQHIAVATLNRADILVSWNFRHIVNFRRIRAYNSVNLRHGYPLLDIRTPREIINENEAV